MAGFDKCFRDTLGADLTPEQLRERADLFTRAYNKARDAGLGRQEALSQAVKEGAFDIRKESIRKILAAQNDAAVRVEIAQFIERGRAEFGGMGAFLRKLSQDVGGTSRTVSMTTIAEGVAQMHGAVVEQALRATDNRKLLRIFEDTAQTRELVRAILSENVGNPDIAAIGKTFREVNESLRVRFNAKGGAIVKMENWLPQHHDAQRLLRAGADKWVAFTSRLMNRRKMLTKTGEVMDDDELSEFLHRAYVTLSENGNLKQDVPGEHSFSARGSVERQLHFLDADSWMKYHAEFGGANLYDILRSHIKRMAHDIAIIETLGSKPSETLREVSNAEAARLNERDASDIERRSFAAQKAYAGLLYDYMAGNIAHEPLPDWRFELKVGDKTRVIDLAQAADMGFNFFRAVNVLKLGMAALSSIPDPAFMTAAASFWNMSKADLWLNLTRRMVNAGDKDRIWLENAGLATDMLRSSGDRIVGETTRDMFVGLNQKVLRLTGLRAWSQAMKDTFAATMSNTVGRMVAKWDLTTVPKGDRKLLDSYGIGEQTWAVWKMAELERWGRARNMLTPRAVLAIPEKALSELALASGKSTAELRQSAASTLAGMLARESDAAINEPGTGQRAAIQRLKSAGPGASWLVNARLQFMSYPISVALTQGRRFMGSTNKWEYAAWGFGVSTLLGGLSLQIKNLDRGRDMQEMVTEDGLPNATFIGASILAGGGLGHYASLVSGFEEQHVAPVEVLLGPTGGALDKLQDVMAEYVKSWTNEDPDKAEKAATNAQDKLVELLPDYVPGARLPWTAPVFKHYVMGTLHEMNNPGFMERQEEKLHKRTGQGQWMGAGYGDFVQRPPETAQAPEK